MFRYLIQVIVLALLLAPLGCRQDRAALQPDRAGAGAADQQDPGSENSIRSDPADPAHPRNSGMPASAIPTAPQQPDGNQAPVTTGGSQTPQGPVAPRPGGNGPADQPSTNPGSSVNAAPPGETGPHEVAEKEIEAGIVYYPKDIAAANSRFPVIAWANGTAFSSKVYSEIISHWVSHGFIVIASKSTMAMVANDQPKMLQAMAETAGEPWDGKVDTDHMGVSGHSQGGSATIAAASGPLVKASIPIQACAAPGVNKISTPALFLSGSADTICPLFTIKGAYSSAGSAIKVHGHLKNPKATHWWETAKDEESYAIYHGISTAWWRWHLKGETALAAEFADGGTFRSGEWSESRGEGL